MLNIQFQTHNITRDLLKDERLETFWDFWQETAVPFRDRYCLHKQDLDPSAFRGFLDFLTMVDVLDDGADFRYRVYGTGVARHFGKDMTGALVSSLPPEASEFQVYFYRQSFETIQPYFCITEAMPHLPVQHWSRLCLPITLDGETVGQLVNLALPTLLRRVPDHYL